MMDSSHTTCSSEFPKLPNNWAREWEASNSMALFVAEDQDWCKIFVINKDTRNVYHVVDYNQCKGDFNGMNCWPACTVTDGKLYLVGDRDPGDVLICDLNLPRPYSWKQGPPMHSNKYLHHLIPFDGSIFVISNPDERNMIMPLNRDDVVVDDPVKKPVVASFEVLDTKDDAAAWEVLPDPPFPDYNNSNRGYRVVSYTVFNDLIYFVFDREENTSTDNYQYEGAVVDEDQKTYDDFIDSKVLAFDPKCRQWLTNIADYEPTLRWYVDMAAHCTLDRNRIVRFVDPSLRCFLMDPPYSSRDSYPIPPCFYTFDYSSWNRPNSEPLPQALEEGTESAAFFYDWHGPNKFLKWFQIYVRPYLCPVTGLSSVMEWLSFEVYRHCNSFILPSYHCSQQDGEHWSLCLVAFVRNSTRRACCSCIVATFKIIKTDNNLFEAKDLRKHIQHLPNITHPTSYSCYSKYYEFS